MASLKCLSGLLLLFCIQGSLVPVVHAVFEGGHQFSLPVSRKANYNRDFARDWIAGRQKWGSNDAGKVSNTFSLGDTGQLFSSIYLFTANLLE